MLVSFKWLVSGLVVVALTGCFKVEDKSDAKVVDSLEQQNQLLEQQLEQAQQQAEQQKTSVTLGGVVTSLSTGNKVSNTTVTVKVGASAPVVATVTNGSFELPKLPADSDYELVIHSTANEFMDRTYFGRTRATATAGAVYQDLGKLEVAAAIEYSFAVFDIKTGTPISTLVFWGNSNSGAGATEESFWHRATYDATTGRYKITLPHNIATPIRARLDLDNDGVNDYLVPYASSASHIHISTSGLNVADNFFLEDVRVGADQSKNVQLRVAVVDTNALLIPDMVLNLQDGVNGIVSSSFDSASNQYVINAILKDSIQVMLPAFSYMGRDYDSAAINIQKADSNTYNVSVNGNYSEVRFDSATDRIFNLVLSPSVSNVYSNLYVVSKTSTVASDNPVFNVFYSGGISLLDNSVTLLRRNIVQIVRGNESSTDSVQPGVTQINLVDEPVAVNVSLTQGNTYLKVEPVNGLSAGGNYEYNVGYVTDETSGVFADVSGDWIGFTLPDTSAVFDINTLRLDNNNYFTGGAIIKAQNTAGATSYASNWSGSVYLYLPKSVTNLKSLILNEISSTYSGTKQSSAGNYVLVSNGSSNLSSTHAFSVAENEYIVGSFAYSFFKGTALADGAYHSYYLGKYMYDSVSGSENSVTFLYSYETFAGQKATGEITLQIQ